MFDQKICDQCLRAAVPAAYKGNVLRSEFPYLEVETENRLASNVHPNCRCWMERLDYVKPSPPPIEKPVAPTPSEGTTWQPEDQGLKRLNPPDELLKKVTSHFGTTTDYREAGYVLPDGTLLDLSGKREGGTPHMRSFDHRDISVEIDTGEYGISGTDAMIYFERECNAMRVHFTMNRRGSDLNVSFETSQTLTDAQWTRLRYFVNFARRGWGTEPSIYYDIYAKDGARLVSHYIDNASINDVNELRRIFLKTKREDVSLREMVHYRKKLS